MTPALPEPIAAYFAATNTHDIDAMLAGKRITRLEIRP